MTKKELSQLYYLNREIEEQLRRLEELETQATSCGVAITGVPKSQKITDRLSEYVAKIADLKASIDKNMKRCFYELNRLTRYINTIDDSEMRLILTFRYINGLTWIQVAFRIGATDESYPRRKHNKFIEDIEKSKLAENADLDVI